MKKKLSIAIKDGAVNIGNFELSKDHKNIGD